MPQTKEIAARHAVADLAIRLGVAADDIAILEVRSSEFPNSALGAPLDGEISAMMMTSGWQIELAFADAVYEYRADERQLRLRNFNGKNYVIVS